MIGLFYRQPRFTDGIQVRAYTIDDVASAFGGFVGLLMGYSLANIPDIAKSVMNYIKENCNSKMRQIEGRNEILI